MIPLCKPHITQDDIDLVTLALTSGQLSHGKYNKQLETRFREMTGMKYAMAVNSCASALEMVIRSFGIEGDVIIPSFTWTATANAVLNCGATPVFCDVDVGTRNVTAELIEKQISPLTEAVIVVHFAGQPCEMDKIKQLCDKYKLVLIEDSAETIGASFKGKSVWGDAVCYSFFPTKAMTTGEGGMACFNNDNMYDECLMLRSHGVDRSNIDSKRPWFREAKISGSNYRLSEINAALGVSQFNKLSMMNGRRKDIAGQYSRGLQNLTEWISLPAVADGADHVYQMYTILTPYRDHFVLQLREKGIEASAHFDPPLHDQHAYLSYTRDELPNTDELSKSIVTLPCYPDMTDAQVNTVISAIQEMAWKLYL